MTDESRMTWLRRLAWACAVLVLAITSLSAFIRLSRTGVGCEPWPQCYVQAADTAIEDAPGIVPARIAHRVTASAALLLVIALVMVALAREPMLWRQGKLALALLALGVFLAMLGRGTGQSREPAVVVANLLGGLAMFALCWRLVLAARERRMNGSHAVRWRGWAWAAIGLALVQMALGGLASTGHAALQEGAGITLYDLHMASALVLAAVALPLALAVHRGGRRVGILVALLVLAQAACGWLLAPMGLPLALALAHNMLAALLLAALSTLLEPA